MTQNEKDLLLKDLCARVPYGVKAISKIPINQNESKEIVGQVTSVHYNVGIVQVGGFDVIVDYNPYFEIKPYLFPLSSMTEEQKQEYTYIVNYISSDDTENWKEGEFIYVEQFTQLMHFYHINHLDYMGLIPMGLANDATGLNIY